MLLEKLDQILPGWMLTGDGAQMGALLGAVAALFDALAEAVRTARLAAFPGQMSEPGLEGLGGFDNTDALPLIGRSRGDILQGLAELPWDYAGRLRRWLESGERAGTGPELLAQLQGVLSPSPPTVRLVSATSEWWTLTSNGLLYQHKLDGSGLVYDPSTGDITVQVGSSHPWDWDSASSPPPPDQNDPARLWPILYEPCNLPYLASDDDTFVDEGLIDDFAADRTTSGAGASPDAGTVGTCSPWKHEELIRNVGAAWRTQGIKLAWWVICFDSGAFDPISTSVPTSTPDGRWGWHTYYDLTDQTRYPGRFPSAEYWPGPPGGLLP